MGTFNIEQYNAVGSAANRDQPVYDITTLVASLRDTTTTTTPESLTLDINARVARIYCTTDHRISINTDTTSTRWVTVIAGLPYDTNIPPGGVLFYREDA